MGVTTVPVLGEVLARAAQRLGEAGIAEPRREADELYAALVCGPTSRAFLDRDQALAPALAERLEQSVARRVGGWPQAYATGRANFRGHWFTADQRALIPRAETETLVDLVIQWAQRYRAATGRMPVVADIGTGSGCIAIAIALEAPVAGVIATDASAEALNLAIENAAALGATERISFRKGDLLAPLLGEPVDAVVSNPPYITTVEIDWLHPLVRDFEPRIALDGGPDGLGLTRRLAAEAFVALPSGGLLAIEVDAGRADASAAILQDAGFDAVEIGEDLFGRPRTVLGRRSEEG
jgi:release factor glutamine methyltransferase